MIFRSIFFLLLLIAVVHIRGYAQLRPTEKFKKWEETLAFSLVMGDFFENDSADIFINGQLFFRNVKLTSSVDGSADIIIDVHKNERGEYKAGIFLRDSMNIMPLPQLISVKIIFNKRPFEYVINPKNGKYALFYKEDKSELVFRQSHRQPTFE